MNTLRFGSSSVVPPTEVSQEVIDIDVTPVMNMFIILIPFLVSMAVFTHLAIVDFSLPPNVAAGLDQSAGKPQLKLTVVVAQQFLGVTRGEQMLDSLAIGPQGYILDSLRQVLSMRRAQSDITNEIVVAVQDPVRFKHVVKVMDICRETGFEKVGLSSAPLDPATGK